MIARIFDALLAVAVICFGIAWLWAIVHIMLEMAQ